MDGMTYEKTPIKTLITRKPGGKGKSMPNKSTTNPEAKTSKKYAKTRGEHMKDMLIVALVVSIIAFIGGMQFAKGNQAQIDRAVNAAKPTVQAQAVAPEASK